MSGAPEAVGLPEIARRAQLAERLDFPEATLEALLACADDEYHVFQIPKRRGGHRAIAAPSSLLLDCQRRIAARILSAGSCHPAARGFVRDLGILDNAGAHLGGAHVLKLDLEDFFGSISEARVVDVFRALSIHEGPARDLARLCCRRGALPQGAATSPPLSNLVAIDLDRRLQALAEDKALCYTRYADDLTFSGADLRPALIREVEREVAAEGFRLHPKKTRLLRNRGRRVVTGISIATDVPKVPRELKRRLRQEVHYVLCYGYLSFADRMKLENPATYLESLLGRLAFWRWVEPHDRFLERHYDDFVATCAEFRRVARRMGSGDY